MTIPQIETPGSRKRVLRLWPGVLAVVLQWLVRFVLPMVNPELVYYAVIGELVGALAVLVWWLFFSRAYWSERLGAIVLMVAGLFLTSRIVHESVAGGMMGLMLLVYAIPLLNLALVLWAVASRHLSPILRPVSLIVAILLGCGAMALVRTGGITGTANSDLRWRWTKTPEERLLARAGGEPKALAAVPPIASTNADWPGFRGPERDGIARHTQLATDWSRSAPVQLWRRAIGPAWSSFAVHGNFFYTQEQRGEDEVVSCYNLPAGAPVWMHRDRTRFYESNAGAGPRATPTLNNGRVYTLGATGILNALDERDGSVIWSRNAASDTHKKVPGWGFAGSPLVLDDMVVAATAGMLAAYDIATGTPRWIGPSGGGGYSSPHLAIIAGVRQILLLSSAGAVSVAPESGKLLWTHSWPGDGIVQPVVLADGDILLGSGSGLASGVGVRRLKVGHADSGWNVQERWTSGGLKPYFSDSVVHEGFAYGFDGGNVACIDVADGTRKWKGGRYGHGQLVALPEQNLLLIASEKGDLALVKATPDACGELGRFPVLKGKTWNHPVLVGDVVLVRNAQEMAAFRLPVARH